jgi:hypothetical protein
MYGVWWGDVVRSQRRPWVARITGIDPVYQFKREFVKGWFDFTNYQPAGIRGRIYFALAPGVYDAFEPLQGKKHYRAFLIVDNDGNVKEASKDEVIQCLKNLGLE